MLQPVEEWTAENVAEWMAALNLYHYAELFKSKGIKGSDLGTLDKEKLMVSTSQCMVGDNRVVMHMAVLIF